MNQQYDFGMIGLGVMGRNLLLNMADKGFATIGFDLDERKCRQLEQEASSGTVVKGVNALPQMLSALKTPRKILLLVPAGKAVDAVIRELQPLLDAGDVVIDGGNSLYADTVRRYEHLKEEGVHFMGMGISGGEKGARLGPSMMPGGNPIAFEAVQPMLEAVAAKADGVPCFAYMGNGGAGHYVKMVHNGIEYAMMQLICEAYDLLKRGAGFSNEDLHRVFSRWNQGRLQSFLIEITAAVFANKDAETGAYLVDMILDKAGAKGTGKWTSQEALALAVAAPTIQSAVDSRTISAAVEARKAAASLYPRSTQKMSVPQQQVAEDLENALVYAFVVAYVQGLHLLAEASDAYRMNIQMASVIRVWKAGCIIRSSMLKLFETVYNGTPQMKNLLLSEEVARVLGSLDCSMRRVVNMAVSMKIPAAAFMSALAYTDSCTAERLPTNLLQAQRDLFGAHTFERTDRPGIFHHDWQV